MAEIEERRSFLEQMERLGKGKQYRAQISMEISQVGPQGEGVHASSEVVCKPSLTPCSSTGTDVLASVSASWR